MKISSLYESVFNGSSIGTCLVSASPDPIILAVNDAFLCGASRSRDDLVGKRLFDAFSEDPDDPNDTGGTALRTSLMRVLDTATAHAMPAQRYPIAVVQASGEICYEERYWSAVNTPIFDENREMVCISHTTADITDQVRAETALRESEERLRAYIVATSDVVYRMSPDWRYMYGLDGRGFLKTTTEWAEWRMEEYVHADELERGACCNRKGDPRKKRV